MCCCVYVVCVCVKLPALGCGVEQRQPSPMAGVAAAHPKTPSLPIFILHIVVFNGPMINDGLVSQAWQVIERQAWVDFANI